MKRFLAFFMSIILLCGFTVQAEECEEPQNLYAQAAVLMDADSGRVLFEKNGAGILPMASTTKIMTCIVALEHSNLEEIVTASSNAAAQPKVHLGMQAEEQFVLGDLLYSLMLESHNDSAVAIAEHVAGSVEKFADMMNQKAAELGCDDTYFITPNGLDATDEKGSHSTTATDLARIMSYCIKESPKKNEFLAITGTSGYTFSNVAGARVFSCTNHNSFLTMMEGAFTGKTGFTGKAGYCYVGALKQDERTFVVALLACGWPNNKNYKWKDTLKLMEYAIENYQYRELKEKIELPEVIVKEGIPESNELFEICYVKLKVDDGNIDEQKFLLCEDEQIEVKIECANELMAPLEAGDKVGTVSYIVDCEIMNKGTIVVAETIGERTISWVFEKLLEMYFGL